MQHLLWFLSRTSLSWTLVVILLFTHDAHGKADLETFFTDPSTRYFPGKADGGGCKGHVSELETGWKEASEMIDAAVAAIAEMNQKPKPSLIKPIQRWNWDKKAQSMLSMFGIKISDKGGPLPESEENFSYVESIFAKMKAGMDTDHPENHHEQGPGLYCGTEGWKYLKPDDAHPHKINQKLSDDKNQYGKPRFPNGAWYLHGNAIQANGPNSMNYCRPEVSAFTLASIRVITWCEHAWTALAKSFDARAIKRFDQLGIQVALTFSHVWVHELAHFYGSYKIEGPESLPDQTAVDAKGRTVFDKDGNPELVYGILKVLLMAQHDSKAACHTADAYAFFATAMHLSGWNWSKGFAEGLF